jgi:hypothetical protein
VRFLFIYFQMFSFDMLFLHCFNVCFLTNIKINNECRHVTEQITQWNNFITVFTHTWLLYMVETDRS